MTLEFVGLALSGDEWKVFFASLGATRKVKKENVESN
jgi:hypothetical protein